MAFSNLISQNMRNSERDPTLASTEAILRENSNLFNNSFDEFHSDEENLPSLHLDFKYDSDSIEELGKELKNEVKKNRRKASTPQRAVQLEFNSETSQAGSIGNTSESSHEESKISLNTMHNVFLTDDEKLEKFGDKFTNTLESFLDFEPDDNAFEEMDIFKDLKEDTDIDQLDEETIDTVKEEWKSNWALKCNMCERVFSFRSEFDKHYFTSYKLDPVYTCASCNKSADKYATFRSHCYRHTTEGKYKCQECPKGFGLQSLLHVHVMAKHTRAKPYVCEECGKSFVTKPGLKIHTNKHKTEAKEDYPCVECGKVLHTRGGLTSHMNVHRLGRRFMCDVCGKTFTQKVNMQQHVKQHTGDKPYTCDKCGKTFAEKSHLTRHYSFHSDQRPFKCNICHKMYKTERCLKVHRMVHAAERPFVCGKCNKGFLSSTKLKQHYNIHTGERPFKCKYCERTFTNYPNWLKHTRRRHKVDHKTGAELNSPPKKMVKILPKVEPKLENIAEESQPSTAQINQPQEQTAINYLDIYTPKKVVKILPKAEPKIESEPSNLNVSPVLTSAQAQEQIVMNLLDTYLETPMVNDQLINDASLARAEELFLQQGMLNFPLLDDRVGFGQQLDLLAANPSTSVNTHYLVPYFQTSPSNLVTMPVQLNDVVTTANFSPQSRD